MKILSILALIVVAVFFVATTTTSAFEQQQQVRKLTASEYASIFSASPNLLENEDSETPNLPWAVLVRFPWNAENDKNSTAISAFQDASSKFPATIVRFGELVLDTPEALAIADLFSLNQIPSVQLLHGQQGRFEQMKNMGGLPFADAPYDLPQNTQGHQIKTSSPATTSAASKKKGDNANTNNNQQQLVIESASAEIVHFISKSLPVTVFSPLDHQEMPSVIKVSSLHEVTEFMNSADQVHSTIVAMQPLVLKGGAKKKSSSSSKSKIGREWIQVAAISTGAQFVGRNGGMIFLLDSTTVQEDDSSISELSISQETLNGKCGSADESDACFDIVSVSLGSGENAKKATTTLVKTSSDISDIHTHVRHSTVVDSAPRKSATRSYNELSTSISGKWSDYSTFVLSRHNTARERYSRIFEPMLSSKPVQEHPPIPQDLVRPLVSTPQFQAELHQSRAGLFVISFLRPSDRHFERHLKSVNEVAANLFRDRRVQEAKHEMRVEFYYVDTDVYPSVAEAFQAAQVPSMFVVHHLENNQHAVAQFRGEFSVEKLKPMEKFVRELCFDSKNLAPFRADKVAFEAKKKNAKQNEGEELLRHSFHIPFMDMAKELSQVLPTPSAFTLVDENNGSGSKNNKKKTSSSSSSSSSNSNKKKETPQQEAKRLKKQAAEKREKEERKKKLEEELEQRRKAKEEKIKQKKIEEEEKKKKMDAENEAKLQKIKEEVRSGKRVKKITREDIRARRDAALKKVKPKKFDYRRQERLEKHLKKERGYVGQVFTEGDFSSTSVLVRDTLF